MMVLRKRSWIPSATGADSGQAETPLVVVQVAGSALSAALVALAVRSRIKVRRLLRRLIKAQILRLSRDVSVESAQSDASATAVRDLSAVADATTTEAAAEVPGASGLSVVVQSVASDAETVARAQVDNALTTDATARLVSVVPVTPTGQRTRVKIVARSSIERIEEVGRRDDRTIVSVDAPRDVMTAPVDVLRSREAAMVTLAVDSPAIGSKRLRGQT